MTQTENKKNEVFKLVQSFLKAPPVIIWGSGATIPYGLPSMEDLKESLKPKLGELGENINLEIELGKIDDANKVYEIKQIIRDIVFKKKLYKIKTILSQ